jgi:uncharacterized protein (TIGR02246 family)
MRLALPFLLVLSLACASSTARDETVRDAMSRFLEALNALDADAIATCFADDVTAFFPLTQGERVDGKAAVVAILRAYAETSKKSVKSTNIVPEDMQIDARGETAIVTFNVRNPSAISRRTFVFRRTGRHWLITHFHASNYVRPR